MSQMVDAVLALPEGTRLMVLAPVVRDRKGEFVELFQDMQAQGLRALPRRRQRRSVEAADAQAEEGREARHRRRHRPLKVRADLQQRLADSAELRGRAAHRRGRASRSDGRARGTSSPEVRLPGLQLLAAGAGAAPVLVQLAGGRLPVLRRPGPKDGVRPERVGGLPVAEPGQRRGEGLGPPQRLHLLAAGAWRATTASTSTPFEELPERRGGCCCTARAETSRSPTRPRAPRQRWSSAGIPSRASSPTSSAAYRETDSAAVREDLARYQAPSPARLQGTRLRPRGAQRLPGRGRRGEAPRSRSSEVERDAARGLHGFESLTLGRQGRDRRQGGARDPLAAQASSTTSA